MKFVLIFGPQAVGKMTVGMELEKSTGFKFCNLFIYKLPIMVIIGL
jgi:shikimate kinase